jgi:hypothetical protein
LPDEFAFFVLWDVLDGTHGTGLAFWNTSPVLQPHPGPVDIYIEAFQWPVTICGWPFLFVFGVAYMAQCRSRL